MGRMIRFVALFAILPVAAPLAAAAPVSPEGVWRNVDDSVRIRVAPCATGSAEPLCGSVVAASDKAKADAAAGGTPQLVGSRLLTDFRSSGARAWAGKAFIPDVGVTLRGTMTLASPDTMEVGGCLIGTIGCRSQRWTRVAEAAKPAPRARPRGTRR